MSESGYGIDAKKLMMLQCYVEATEGENPEAMEKAVRDKLTETTKGADKYPQTDMFPTAQRLEHLKEKLHAWMTIHKETVIFTHAFEDFNHDRFHHVVGNLGKAFVANNNAWPNAINGTMLKNLC